MLAAFMGWCLRQSLLFALFVCAARLGDCSVTAQASAISPAAGPAGDEQTQIPHEVGQAVGLIGPLRFNPPPSAWDGWCEGAGGMEIDQRGCRIAADVDAHQPPQVAALLVTGLPGIHRHRCLGTDVDTDWVGLAAPAQHSLR